MGNRTSCVYKGGSQSISPFLHTDPRQVGSLAGVEGGVGEACVFPRDRMSLSGTGDRVRFLWDVAC